MAVDPKIQKLREAIQAERKRPPQERFQEMVDSGAIDKDGRVLLRAPEPPPGRGTPPASAGSEQGSDGKE